MGTRGAEGHGSDVAFTEQIILLTWKTLRATSNETRQSQEWRCNRFF